MQQHEIDYQKELYQLANSYLFKIKQVHSSFDDNNELITTSFSVEYIYEPNSTYEVSFNKERKELYFFQNKMCLFVNINTYDKDVNDYKSINDCFFQFFEQFHHWVYGSKNNC